MAEPPAPLVRSLQGPLWRIVLIDMLDRDPSEDRYGTYVTAREVAAEALAQLGDPRAFEPLVRTLRDGDGHNRVHAALALGNLGDERGVEVLLGVLQVLSRKGFVGRSIAEAS